METKTYITTDKAGPRVAGKHVPCDVDGNAQAGFEIELTERQAEYELAQGTIVLKPEGKAGSAAKALPKPAGDGGASDGAKAV